MPYLPLNIPPGVKKGGTDLQSSGRWADANLVRWHEGNLMPVGGWRNRSNQPVPYPIRGLFGWKSNSGSRYVVGGTYEKLYVWMPAGAIYDITPTSFGVGQLNATGMVGYGSGYYNTQNYNEPRSLSGTTNQVLLPSTGWTFSTFGENLIANSPDDGKVYQWALTLGTPAQVLSNAPTSVRAICVDDQRFLWAFQAREVYWSDQEDNNTWTSTATNQAGQITLQTTGRIVCAEKTRGGIVILTTDDCHATQYIGQPFIHSIQRVGTSCGIISSLASVSIDIGVVWMGEQGFFRFSGGQVMEIPCEVSDHVYSNLNTSQQSKCHAVSNAKYDEVIFFYPSGNSEECDNYASWNYKTNTWAIGKLARSSGIDVGTFALPLYTTCEYILRLSSAITGTIAVGDTITGANSTATATVLGVDTSGANPLISVTVLSGTFQNENITSSSGGSGSISAHGHFLQEHEVGSDYTFASELPFVESGAIQIGAGDRIMAVNEVIPDEKTLGSVTANFKTRLFPTGQETDHGSVTLTNPTSVRFQGREIRMRLTNASNDWRVGSFRLNAIAGSKR